MYFFISFALDIIAALTYSSHKLKRLLYFVLILLVISLSALFINNNAAYATPILVLLPFRIFNISRLIKGRMHAAYMRKAVSRTSVFLLLFHLAFMSTIYFSFTWIWSWLPIASLILSATILGLLIYHLRKTRHITNRTHYSDKELPTVSVCIPARNETNALEDCLRSVLANDYPKLEILVLDDCSQDRTAEVIKSFAHAGVRFIQGEDPKERWLAKNQAYDKLAHEATGELILFCGVDVRLGSTAIRALVTTLLNRKKSMISVMPLRFYSKATEALVQPMRYWWELVPPRKLFKRPAVLSTCWLVNRKQLKKAGGFAAVSHAIIPEGYFARHFIKTDAYSFIRADEDLDVRTTKPLSEQWATAIRTSYPQIRRRPEMALLLTLFTLSVLVMPFITLPLAAFTLNIPLTVVSILTCIFLTLNHVLILQYSDPGNVPIGFISLPVCALTEVVIGYSSMFKYEFGSVNWKDRNVCIPVMHVVPKSDFLANGKVK